MNTLIKSYDDLFKAVGIDTYLDFDRTWAGLSKAIYKRTTYGAWVGQWENTDPDGVALGVVVGTIVEGVDQCPAAIRIPFPFEIDEFWNALTTIDSQADEIWRDTHGCPDCWPGYDGNECAINPHCETCGGEGVIL